jgi:predicted DNA-binding ribbon-helix-helix protein
MAVYLQNSIKNKIRKRSVMISGHATSISIEEAFWDALKVIAEKNNLSINSLIEKIDKERPTNLDGSTNNLSSAVRVFILDNKSV